MQKRTAGSLSRLAPAPARRATVTAIGVISTGVGNAITKDQFLLDFTTAVSNIWTMRLPYRPVPRDRLSGNPGHLTPVPYLKSPRPREFSAEHPTSIMGSLMSHVNPIFHGVPPPHGPKRL